MKVFRFLFVVVFALFSATFLTPAASAHDEVVSTSPSSSTEVAAGQFTVSVTFNEEVLTVSSDSAIAIKVLDPDGETVSNGCVDISGSTIGTQVDVDKAGTYKVLWQSVSGDGHPSTGNFEFSVANGNGYQSKGLVDCSPTVIAPAPDSSESPIPIDGQVMPYMADDTASSDWTWPVFGIFVVIAVALGYLVRRRKIGRRN